MPRWTVLIRTNPEVDDDDLPLPEHRIFDDNGNFRSLVKLVSPSKATVSARRESPRSSLRRSPVLKVVGKSIPIPTKKVSPSRATPKSSASSAKKSRSPSPSKQTSPLRQTSVVKSPAPVRPSFSKSKSPSKTSKSPKKQKGSPSKSPSRRKTPSAKKSSRAPSRKSSKRAKSSSKSNKTSRTGTPSPKWTILAIKEYANEHSIDVKGLRVKADLLHAVNAK